MKFDSIVDVVREFGVKNVVVTIPMRPLRYIDFIPGFAMMNSSDESVIVAGFIEEDRYKVEDNYKITLAANDARFGRKHYYICDLNCMIRSREEIRVFYLHEDGDKHMGFIIITICHIVAGTLFSWLPLTQGLYISHMTSQPECMVFQMAECLVIGTGVAVILKNKQEYIILRKWKAENI
jgi:hypothetical protein